MPKIDKVNKILLLPNSLIIADMEKLRKKPRTADKSGMQKTPSMENPKNTERR